ncbi:hypothetical protein KAJ38_02665 [Candidatus Pacearchaeota archaeon]|nr:hypothetical protein [Candidatus Pacearchaeota archaeon]
MTLKLNTTREVYKEFYGKNTEQMPKLLTEDRIPMSVAGLMRRRLEVRNSDAEVKDSYMHNYFDTGDAIAYHPDGRIKIVLDSQHLRNKIPQYLKEGEVLALTVKDYENLRSEEFKEGRFGKIETLLSKKEVKSHPVWKVLARDQILLNDYVDYIFTEGKQRFDYNTAMEIRLEYAGKNPKITTWCIYSLPYRSDAAGNYNHDDILGRLVGVIPEKLNTSNNVKAYTLADTQRYVKAIKGLKSFFGSDSDLVRDLSVLEDKL